MRKGKLMVKTFGIGLVFVVIGLMLGGLTNTISGASAPPPPTPRSPDVYSSRSFSPIYTLTPTFEWEGVAGAGYYGLYIEGFDKDKKDWIQIFNSQKKSIRITGKSYTLEPRALKWGKRYRWYMNSHSSAGWGDYSDKLYFWIAPPKVKEKKTTSGIDVSSHQGENINWNQVYKAGYKFAFVRATMGIRGKDDYFITNMQNAKKVDEMLVGAYHFAYPNLNLDEKALFADAEAEAKHFVNVAKDYLKEGYLRPALDVEDKSIEDGTGTNIDNVTEAKKKLSQWIEKWTETVEKETKDADVKPILYMPAWWTWEKKYIDESIANEYELWVPYYGVTSPKVEVWKTWAFWQYSEEGFVPGISGTVDMDLFNGTVSELKEKFVIKAKPKPISASDIILVMDVSGSMNWTWKGEEKLTSAKKASKALIDMASGERLAVVTFADDARTEVGLTSDFNAAKTTIVNLRARGDTNIGDALGRSLNELAMHSGADTTKAIIFFTDGHITTGVGEDEVLGGPIKQAIDKDVVIYAIGYGDPSYLHDKFLKEMAESTGGKYYYGTEAFQLQNVFIEAGQKAEGWDVEATFTGSVKHQETVTAGTFDLTSRPESLKVILNWPGSDLDLKLLDPRGKGLDYLAPDVAYSGDVKPEYVVIKKALPGTWTAKVHGKAVPAATEYCLWIATYTTPRTPSSFIQFIPLVVSIALLLFIVGYFTRRSI